MYLTDLLQLATVSSRVPLSLSPPPFPGELPSVQEWQPFLASHPDRSYARYIREGLTYGFRIGFNESTEIQLHSAFKNHVSVTKNPQAVADFISSECALGRMNGPFPASQVSGTQISPLGIIPKPHQPGKWRLIVDLSFPEGHSVNNGISPALCSIKYSSVDDAVSIIQKYGPHTQMAKLDLQSAYRMVPVHPEDHRLLGMQWNDHIYIDTRLPFGLRSAPKIFSAVADGIAWAMHCLGIVDFLHYLDDYLFLGPPSSQACHSHLKLAITLCKLLGFPVAPEKIGGPSTVLTFLGIELDSSLMQLRLPPTKLQRLKALLVTWLNKRAATKRELQSIIGHLSHAATVVRPGRAFTRGLIETSKIPKCPSHWVRLSPGCQADIAWWYIFLDSWNGSSMMPPLQPSVVTLSDASGSWGCGATSGMQWFQLQWPPQLQGRSTPLSSIAVKEMIPVVISAAIWGLEWTGKHVLFRCDNSSVVSILTHWSAKDTHLAHLSRCLFFFAAHYNFTFTAEHIAGGDNKLADALSRNNLTLFLTLFPQASPSPSPIPKALSNLLLEHPIEWTSPVWRQQFRDSTHRALPLPHVGYMNPP